MKYGISFRDPTAETASMLRDRAQPLATLKGKTVALMDIGIKTRRYKKPTNTRVAPREMIKDIAEHCDAVIIALSDCGSCTSCSTHDLNDLDKNGIAGVSVLTTEFQQAFESQKAAIGLDAAAVYVPHPLQNKTTAELHEWANAAVDKILHAIAHDTSRATALETV
jgi:hypothetical protein